MKSTLVFFVLQVLLLATCASAANILVIFSSPSRSHNVLGVKLCEGLLKKGHHVTFLNPFPSPKMENFTVVHMDSISEFFKGKQNV